MFVEGIFGNGNYISGYVLLMDKSCITALCHSLEVCRYSV